MNAGFTSKAYAVLWVRKRLINKTFLFGSERLSSEEEAFLRDPSPENIPRVYRNHLGP